MIFAPLHIISGYSFLKSGLTMDKIVSAIKKNDYFGAAITDYEVLFGAPHFVHEMEKINKPYLLGIECNIDGDDVSIFALNEEGYRRLGLISTALQNKQDIVQILNESHSGLIGVIDTKSYKFKESFPELDKVDTSFTKYLLGLSKLFDDFYLGIEVISKEDVHYANKIRKFAKEYSYETIAFPRILYLNKEDAIILDIVHAIANDEKISIKEKSGQQYFMKEADYQKIYNKAELANTIKLVQSSSLNFSIKRGELLHYPVDDSPKALKEMVLKGLEEKVLKEEKYINRANYELDIITSMGFADYFLIVQDFVKYAESQNILVGPGRGSSAGSLVAYSLGITKIDPIRYGLQFERFLNPGRKTMPDIDVDFMDTRKEEMFDYMKSKYGDDRVGFISTFQTILAKQALRDIGRIYEYHDWLIDNLSKAIPNSSKDISFAQAYRSLPAFKKLVDSDPYYLEIVSLAKKIEGLPRQNGIHPAGVILNDTDIKNVLPMTLNTSNYFASQYEAPYLEEQGFLKMDFLSLRNLTTIVCCTDLINQRHPEAHLDPKNIDFDKPETYELIAKGQLTGIFQLESAGMRRAIMQIKPTCFEDIIAVISLFRPGPMANIPTYARRKHGVEKVSYISDSLKDILEETYGVITYQEQVNSIAMKMAGFTLSEADLFRRGISKKKVDVLKEMEEKFINGSIKNGYTPTASKQVYDAIMKFAGYGFNKSHAAVYAYIACEMAYLKAHYPLEFYTAIMQTASSTSDNKFAEYVSEMKARNIPLYLPDVNHSERTFIIYNDGLLYPLGEIRGVNYQLVDKIIEERNVGGEFNGFFNFINRMYPYRISESNLQHLIYAGVFDSFNKSRASLLASINKGLQYAELNSNESGQMALDASLVPTPDLTIVKDNPIDNLDKEYEALGIMISDNPLTYKKDLYDKYHIPTLNEAKESKGNIKILGIVKTIKTISTKKGTPMAFIKLFDQSAEFEVTFFSDLYSDNLQIIKKNNILLIEGSNKVNKGETSFIASKVELVED